MNIFKTKEERKEENSQQNIRRKRGFGGFGQKLCKKCGKTYTSDHCSSCYNGGVFE